MEFKAIEYKDSGKWKAVNPELFRIRLSGPQGERWLTFREVYPLATAPAKKTSEPAASNKGKKAADDDDDSDDAMEDAPPAASPKEAQKRVHDGKQVQGKGAQNGVDKGKGAQNGVEKGDKEKPKGGVSAGSMVHSHHFNGDHSRKGAAGADMDQKSLSNSSRSQDHHGDSRVQAQAMMQLSRQEQQRAQEFMLVKLSMDEGLFPSLIALQKKIKERSSSYWPFGSGPSIDNDLKAIQLQTFGFFGLLDKNRTDKEYLAKVRQYWNDWIKQSEERKNPLEEFKNVLTPISRMLERVPDQPPQLPVLGEAKTPAGGKGKVSDKGFDGAAQAFVKSSEMVYAACDDLESQPERGAQAIKEHWKPPSDQESASKYAPDLS